MTGLGCFQMGVLIVTCPYTQKAFSTGINIERDDFNLMCDVVASSRCPYCKRDHRWRYRNAEYRDAIPDADWVENR